MSARTYDTNGWYEIASNPITRVGVFQYRGSSIKGPDPNKMYSVLRGVDQLSDPEALNSFRLLPLINDHTMLGNPTTDDQLYVPAEQKGVHGVLGDNVWYNSDDGVVYANLKVFSQTLGRAIDGGKRELSMGYKSLYDWTPGTWNGIHYDCRQVRIRGNHMALVPDGRMGDDVAVMDGEVVMVDVFTFDEKDAHKVIKLKTAKPDAYKAIVRHVAETIVSQTKLGKVNKFAVQATFDAADAKSDPSLADIADLLGDVMPQISDINDSLAGGMGSGDDDMESVLDSAGNAVMDAAGKPLFQKKGTGKAAAKTDVPPGKPSATVDAKEVKDVFTMDAMEHAIAKAVTAAVAPLHTEIATLKGGMSKGVFADLARRDSLVKSLTPFVGTFDHAEMGVEDVAKYGVKKLEIPVVAGHEVAAITAYLHGRTPARPTHTIANLDRKEGEKSSVDSFLAGDDMKTA